MQTPVKEIIAQVILPPVIIRRIIEHGSVHESLVSGYLDVRDLLTYLIDAPVSTKTLIAYRGACLFSKYQLVGDNENQENQQPFILLCKPDYVPIYIISNNGVI